MAAISPEEFYKEFTKDPATLTPEGISKEQDISMPNASKFQEV